MTPAAKAKPGARDRQGSGDGLLISAALRERVEQARAADPLELEQALLRVAMYPFIYLYFLCVFLWDGTIDGGELLFLQGFLTVIPLVFLPLALALLRPGVSVVRRSTGIAIDMLQVTLGLLLTDERGAALYGFYLWVMIGNGFRFGVRYLFSAQLCAFASFALVLAVNPAWGPHREIGAALLLVLVLIPAYLGLLVSRFHAQGASFLEARREAEGANAAKTKLLAAASHDLRQPMQALSMYASVLEQRAGDADARRVVNGIQLSVTALEQMFDSLLDVARLESGVIQPSVVAFPLAPLMERVAHAEAALAAHKGLVLRVAPTRASGRSDPALLERMLKNLLTNAIRYTERGGIVVGCRRAGPGRLRLAVVDTGAGIALQERERIFDEYYQIGGRNAQGLGLGLSIVKSLGELLGHAVGVRSTPGRGSAFWVEIERAVAPEPELPVALGPAADALRGASVLVVDDDVEIRRSMRLLLESWGCRVAEAASAAEAEERLGEAEAHALIVDYRLAGSANGLQAVARLRAACAVALPALLVTGTPAAELAEEARSVNVVVAVKPVPPGKLRAFLEQAVRGRG